MKLRPAELENKVFEEMQNRIKQLEIAKKKRKKPNSEIEKTKAEIIRIDDEINKLMDKLADADKTLFEYIQERISTLHSRKSDYQQTLLARERKFNEVDTTPLLEPLARWEELSIQEKHDVAAAMIEVIYISDDTGIDIRFSI